MKITSYLKEMDRNTPIQLLKRSFWGTATGFYSLAAWQTTRAVIHTAASTGINCLKNVDHKLFIPIVKSGAILALKEGASCSTQSLQIPLLIGLVLATGGMAVYCAKRSIEKTLPAVDKVQVIQGLPAQTDVKVLKND